MKTREYINGMNSQKTRHTIEYEIIPEYVFSNQGADFVNTVLVRKQSLFVDLYKSLNSDNEKYICPYTEDDFGIDAMLVGANMAAIIRVTMPPILADGDLIRIYFCHDSAFDNIRLYTVMVDEDGDTRFMTWVDDWHFKDHGKFTLNESQEQKNVIDLYVKYLSEVGYFK